jgi:hypothetical protein
MEPLMQLEFLRLYGEQHDPSNLSALLRPSIQAGFAVPYQAEPHPMHFWTNFCPQAFKPPQFPLKSFRFFHRDFRHIDTLHFTVMRPVAPDS